MAFLDSQLSGAAANAAAANNVSLTPVAGTTAFCSGFQVTGGGATGASVITVTLTGLLGGTLTYKIAVPAGATASTPPLVVAFTPPRAGSAAGQVVTLNVPSFGAGNTDAAADIVGFQQ